jgi:type I restriction enzyme S subunit
MIGNNKWREVLIPEVLFFQEGPGVRNTQFRESGVKLLNVGNINNGVINLSSTKTHLSEEEAFGKYSHFLVDDGDLLIACSGIIVENFHNKIALASSEHLPLCLNTSTMRFKPLNKENLNILFFRYYLQSEYFKSQLVKLITGSAQLNFGPSHIKKIKLPLPPLPQQQKIANILDAADALRQNDKALIAKYDELTQALFLDMFGDPVSNPKGFELSTVGIQCNVKGGKRVPKEEKLVSENTGFPYIKAGNIKSGKVTLKDLEYLLPQTREKLKRYIVEKGDVCITVVGANIGDIGIVPEELHLANLTENANKILIKDKLILNNYYLAKYLQMDFVQKNISAKTMAVGVPKLALFRIEQIELLIPPIALQRQYEERVAVIEEQKAIAQKSLEKSERLFNSLLQKAFKGELV